MMDPGRMPPPAMPTMPLSALSSLFGSISIACWIVVFLPQIISNLVRQSTDGLSLLFLVIWLAGDVFNIIGAVLQGVLPTMTVLAVYYTVADVVLLFQFWWYHNRTADDSSSAGESDRLLGSNDASAYTVADPDRRSFLRKIFDHADHLSPVVPMSDDPPAGRPANGYGTTDRESVEIRPRIGDSTSIHTFAVNLGIIIAVCASGVLGWYVSHATMPVPPPDADPITMSFWGQVFGYICAVLYLTSRLPQIVLNYQRKSTDGVAILFFLFACLGNGLYVASILAYEAPCSQSGFGCRDGQARQQYLHNLVVNASWLAGSLGTLLLDFVVLGQFLWYSDRDDQ